MSVLKKMILPVLIGGTIGFLGYKYGFDELFTLGAVKKVRVETIEEVRKEADETEKRFRKQLESSEKAGNAYEKLGEKYLEKKDWTPAIEAFNKAIEYGSSGARVHYSLGVAYVNRAAELSTEKDVESAEHHYRRALKINPEITDAEYGLALLYFYLKNDRDKGIELMKRIVLKDSTYYDARFALARFHYETGNPVKALSLYEDLYSDLQKNPESPVMKKMMNNCKENIDRLMAEVSTR